MLWHCCCCSWCCRRCAGVPILQRQLVLGALRSQGPRPLSFYWRVQRHENNDNYSRRNRLEAVRNLYQRAKLETQCWFETCWYCRCAKIGSYRAFLSFFFSFQAQFLRVLDLFFSDVRTSRHFRRRIIMIQKAKRMEPLPRGRQVCKRNLQRHRESNTTRRHLDYWTTSCILID